MGMKETEGGNSRDGSSAQDLRGISKTLLLPLYFRAMESKRADAIVKDDYALELVDKIRYDFSAFKGAPLMQVATLRRVREFDICTRAFISECPTGVVVNIGCGLDTRFHRVDNGTIEWYDLDLPEVIALRRRFLRERARCHCIDSSALDFSWMNAIPDRGVRPFLFLAEGVFIYLVESEVRSLVVQLREQFPGATLVFDAVSPFQALFSWFNPTLEAINATFRWWLCDARDVEEWAPGIELTKEVFYFDQPEPRLGPLSLLQLLPHVSRGFRVVQCKLGSIPPGAEPAALSSRRHPS